MVEPFKGIFTGGNTADVRREQLAAFQRQVPVTGLAGFVCVLLVTALLWRDAPSSWLLVWAACTAGLSAAMLAEWIGRRFFNRPLWFDHDQLPVRSLMALLRGACWGALALFFPHLPLTTETLVVILLTGMSAAAAATLSVIPQAAAGYVLGALTPVCLHYFGQRDMEHTMLAGLALVFMIGLIHSSRITYRSIVSGIYSRLYVDDLRHKFGEERQEWVEFSESTDAFALFDNEDRLLLWNANYWRVLDIPAEAMQRGADLYELRKRGAKPIAVAFEEKSWEEWFAETQRQGLEGDEQIYLLANGRWLRTTVRRTNNGHLAVVHVDITELKNREEALLQATQNLEQQATEIRYAYRELESHHRRIEETSRELTLARDEALRADRAKTEFLANMSHELRTPLNAIIGFSQMMTEEIFGALGNANYKGYAQNIADSGEHLLHLINEILDLSKVAAGKMELLRGEVAMPRLIDSCSQILASIAANKRIHLTAQGDHAEWPLLAADEMKLKQALLNLMSNALKFTPEGGRVTVETRRLANGDFQVAVADTGIGMNEEDIPFVMEPFRRLSSAYDGAFQGTGLGLPLARAFIELHGGELQLSSELHKGTRVAITLPAGLAIDESSQPLSSSHLI